MGEPDGPVTVEEPPNQQPVVSTPVVQPPVSTPVVQSVVSSTDSRPGVPAEVAAKVADEGDHGGNGKEKKHKHAKEGKHAKGAADDKAETPKGEKADKDEKKKAKKLSSKKYEKQLSKMNIELVKAQEWIKAKGLKVVVVFEGRDAAGKGGVIKRISDAMNPRICRVVALGTPTEREKSQWYFQRYATQLPGAGEMVLFDRSWYNRAGVERVMGFCTDEEYAEFLRSCPEFERMLIRSGIILIKYWFSVSDEEQERRFQQRLKTPTKRWKLSPMDLESRARWEDYSKAKDEMFAYTDTKQSPWYVVNADNKKASRLNCIKHLLSMIPYEDMTPDAESVELPPRRKKSRYERPPLTYQTFVPESYV